MIRHTTGVRLAWELAAAEAHAGCAQEIEPAHLLLGICKVCDLPPGEAGAEADELRALFERAGLNPTRFRRRLRGLVARPGQFMVAGVMHRDQATRRVFRRADDMARAEPGDVVRLDHLLRALLELPASPWVELMGEMGVAGPLAAFFPAGCEEARSATPHLDRFGRDLTALARQGRLNPMIGRRAEIRSLAHVLARARKSNPLLVGEAGVGKTCIVEGLAQRLADSSPPAVLAGLRLVELPMAAVVAGTTYRGEFEQRLQSLLAEVREAGDVVLFIDEVHTGLGAGASRGGLDAANILKPALARGELRLIGATTVAEYRRHIEADPALERRFHLVWVDEPTRAEAVTILRGLRPSLESHHTMRVSDSAIDAAVELSLRYLPDLRLPDKAVDLIDQACAAGRCPTLNPSTETPVAIDTIGRAEVAAVVAQRCRLPVDQVTQDEAQRLLGIEQALRARVIGQDQAVATVASAIHAARAGLRDPKRPAAVFLFVGASGVGKTALAKALAEFLFDDQRRLIRIDMSEYTERHAVSRLIGAPPGYIGHDHDGQLTGPVRTHPFSVVLFDEVEKAHPDVLNLLLQILDDGQLTDARGRRASFSEAVIILTSNIGASAPGQPIGFAPPLTNDTQRYRSRITAALETTLTAELRSRIAHTVLFYPLRPEVIRDVLDKVLDALRARLQSRAITITLPEDAYQILMAQGFDPTLGARPLEQAVDRLLAQPLAQALLEGRIHNGDTVHVSVQGDQLLLSGQGTRPVSDCPILQPHA